MNLLLPDENYYLFDKVEGGNTAYFFKTIHDVEYKVIFKPSPYIFGEDKPYASLLYEFSVLAKFAGAQSYMRDDLIAFTIAVIFLNFYNLHDKNICFYICDSADERQHERKQKIDSWFDQYNRGAFVKIDEKIKENNETKYPVSIVLKSSNPYRTQVFDAFVGLMDTYNNGK